MNEKSTVVPSAVELRPAGLRLRWPDREADLRAGELRAACRCAACRAAALRGEPHVPAPRVCLTGAAPVGRYALQLLFSDGHERGIYPWQLLREMAVAAPPSGVSDPVTAAGPARRAPQAEPARPSD